MYKEQNYPENKIPNHVLEPIEILNITLTLIPEDNKNYLNECESTSNASESSEMIPSPKRIKREYPPGNRSPEYADTSFLDDLNIDEIVACLDNSNDGKPCTEEETDNLNNKDAFNNNKSLPLNEYQYKVFAKLEKVMFIKFKEKFSVLTVIHCGQFSRIFKCEDSSEKTYVVKMLKEDTSYFRDGYCKNTMLSKIQDITNLKYYFCVYLYDSFSFEKQWCFLMEFYPKNLREHMESGTPFHIDNLKLLGSQLVGAVTVLRNNRIVHADINPNHILLNDSNSKLRLCGFDQAFYSKYKNPIRQFGELRYRAPEVILGHSTGFSIDVWGTALVLYEMATAQTLFRGYSENDMLYRQMNMLGNVPSEMLYRSFRKKEFFKGTSYIRKLAQSKTILIHDFKGTNVIRKSIYSAHIQGYGTMTEKDFEKINPFVKLLTQMLTIYPKNRININSVNDQAWFHTE